MPITAFVDTSSHHAAFADQSLVHPLALPKAGTRRRKTIRLLIELADARTGKNGRHRLAGLLRQSVFGRLAGYEDVNDAERLCHDPAMRWVVGDRAISGSAASASQMGRFETKWLSRPENLAALADLPGQWIDTVRRRRRPKVDHARHGFEREPDLW